MNYNYSQDAVILIKSLKIFDKKDFEKWHKEKNIFITIQHYLDFVKLDYNLISRVELLKDIKDIVIDIDLQFQDVLKPIIENSNIDIDNLKKSYLLTMQFIGSGSIVHYLNDKVVK